MKNVNEIANEIISESNNILNRKTRRALQKYLRRRSNDDFNIRLANGESSIDILKNYYSTKHFASKNIEYHEAMVCLAFAPIQFFKDLASQLKLKLADILRLFKDSRVVKFFSKFKWDFKKLWEFLQQGWSNAKELMKVIREYVENNKIVKWTTDHLRALDDFLQSHPKTKRMLGFGLAALLVYIWLTMAFSGDPAYDFDMSDVLNAFSGSYSFANIFGGANGVKLLMLFITGAVLKAGFPWPGPQQIQFAGSIIYSLAQRLRQKIQKE